MRLKDRTKALDCATAAALEVGALMRDNLRSRKKINAETHHDIKLELDVRSQQLIEKRVRRAFPEIAVLGEEGVSGDPNAEYRWVIDPIDGTVNFSYGIPHACTSIALQGRTGKTGAQGPEYETLVGVVYDPFCDELWTAVRGQAARLNKRPIRVSSRDNVEQSVVAIGFAKYDTTVEKVLPVFARLIRRVRKIRLMGSAALSMVYVATGRMDAYIEYNIRLWDIAAGGLILECAGGDFFNRQLPGEHMYRILANNGPLGPVLHRLTKS